MKKLMLLFVAVFSMAQMNANTPEIATNEAPAATMAADDDNESTYQHPFKDDDKSTKHWTITTSGFYVGMGIKHNWEAINNSFEVGLLNVAAVNYNSLHGQNLSLGVGIHHRSYSIKRPNMLVCGQNYVGTVPYPDGYNDKNRSSNLNKWAVQFPLMFRQKIYKNFGIKIGGIMNWNFRAVCSNHYEYANVEFDVTYKGLKQNKLTFDAIGGLTVGGIGVYCRYSPGKFFEDGYGPEIKQTWTMGLMIGL